MSRGAPAAVSPAAACALLRGVRPKFGLDGDAIGDDTDAEIGSRWPVFTWRSQLPSTAWRSRFAPPAPPPAAPPAGAPLCVPPRGPAGGRPFDAVPPGLRPSSEAS